MTKIFTENDLIRYIYGETDELETNEIQQAVICDPELSDKLSGLQSIYDGLNQLFTNPSDRAMERIFKYPVV